MEFTITQKNLQKAMSVIGGCIEKKSNGIAANNVLIESLGENNIRFTAMGQDLTMRFDIEADVKKGGDLCLDGSLLALLAPTLPVGDVSFKKDDKQWAQIMAGKSKPRIAGVDSEKFPKSETTKSTPIEFKATDFKELIRRTIFAGSEEASQYALNGVKLEIGNGEARAVTTDIYRLAYATCKANKKAALDLIIPKRAAIEILKIESETIRIGDDENHIFIEGDGLLLDIRKLGGKFPDYTGFFPKSSDGLATFDIKELRESLKRCAMFAYLNTVRCSLSKNLAILSSQTADAGEIEESIEIEYSGEPIELGFDWPNLLDFLNLGNEGKASLVFSKDIKLPALLTAESLPNYQYILVLLNLKSQDIQKAAATEKAKTKTK